MKTSPRLLVAYKKSGYQKLVVERGNERIGSLVDEGHISVRNLESSHSAHQRSLDRIVDHLDELGISYDLKYRGDVTQTKDYDLVVAVGGDGTVLDLSHRIEDTPMVAINSDPDMSIGYFTAGTAFDLDRIVHKILTGASQALDLARFHVCIDDRRQGPPILNDILICHHNPAAVSSYLIKVGAHPSESQKSSGIWISTPAGSTAAIRSAGGLVLPFDSKNLQYLVREPCPPRQGGYRFLKGIQPADEGLQVISRMPRGKVFIDGPHQQLDFPIGATLAIDPTAPPLTLFGIHVERRTA